MKSIIFDTGPIISLASNNLLWLLASLKKKYGGRFFVTPAVKVEAVDHPINSKKFKFEAIQVLRELDEKVLEVYTRKGLREKTNDMLSIANRIFSAHDNTIDIVSAGEVEVLCAALYNGAEAVVIDEFITRALIDDPLKVRARLHHKLHTRIRVDGKNLTQFRNQVKDLKVIRSVELVTIAFELGLLDEFSPKSFDKMHPLKTLLEGLLWGIKLNGCSLTTSEIEQVLKLEIV